MSLELWNRLNQPPKWALKQIGGGRLKGFTDINPQWRVMTLTEQMGPCGFGWKYTIDKLWTEAGIDGQVFAFASISLFIREPEGQTIPTGRLWSDAIPGIGGSMLIEKQSNGLYHNDEAYKMAVTDALSVAMKAIGVAADIYMGLWDGSKYREVAPDPKKEPPKQPPAQQKAADPAPVNQTPPPAAGATQSAPGQAAPTPAPEQQPPAQQTPPTTHDVNELLKPINMTQFEHVRSMLKKQKVDPKRWKPWLKATFQFESANQITLGKFKEICDIIEKDPAKINEYGDP